MNEFEGQRKRVAAVVLTYHPGPGVVSNIKLIQSQTDRVFVVNNELTAQTSQMLSGIAESSEIEFLNQEKNLGVAAGFNAGLRKALEAGFDYFVLFDQDSQPSPDMIEKLLAVFNENIYTVGIVGPNLRDQKTGRYFNFKGKNQRQDLLISSGSLFSKELVTKIGLLKEEYFIDYVDHEYCLRSLRAGRFNFIACDAVLNHQFGDPVKKRFLGQTVTVSNYSPLRHYYMARNRVWLLRAHGCGGWFLADLRHAVKMLVKIVLFESEKKEKIAAFIRGTFNLT